MALRSSDHDDRHGDVAEQNGDVPEPSASSAASLVVADLVTRTGSRLLRHFVERNILKTRVDKKTAKHLLGQRPVRSRLTSAALAQIATRSVPGAAIVGTGLLAGTIYRRGKIIRDAKRGSPAGTQGDTQADIQADIQAKSTELD